MQRPGLMYIVPLQNMAGLNREIHKNFEPAFTYIDNFARSPDPLESLFPHRQNGKMEPSVARDSFEPTLFIVFIHVFLLVVNQEVLNAEFDHDIIKSTPFSGKVNVRNNSEIKLCNNISAECYIIRQGPHNLTENLLQHRVHDILHAVRQLSGWAISL